MNTVSFRYVNENASPIIVQVEPWAGVYRLFTGDELILIAESETVHPEFEMCEEGETRYVTIVHSDEYFVFKDGVRQHWTKCPAFGFEDKSEK